MIFEKKALPLEKQADQLIGRALSADRDELIDRLKVVNYYRLSGYLYAFRVRVKDAAGKDKVTDGFMPGTTLDKVWRRYSFDRRLRIILLDAIEWIEVAVRTRLVYHFVQAHGPFGHVSEGNLPGFKKHSGRDKFLSCLRALLKGKTRRRSDHEQWLSKLQAEKQRSSKAKSAFTVHFETTYGDKHPHLPLWVASELMTCETVLTFANAVDRQLVKQVAADFGFPDDQLLSWMKGIFALRNACAHQPVSGTGLVEPPQGCPTARTRTRSGIASHDLRQTGLVTRFASAITGLAKSAPPPDGRTGCLPFLTSTLKSPSVKWDCLPIGGIILSGPEDHETGVRILTISCT